MAGGTNDIPSTNGAVTHRWFGGRRAAELVERVGITDGIATKALLKKLPARSRHIMTSLKIVATVGIGESDNSGTSVLCDTFGLCNALPTTNATSSLTTMIMATMATAATSTSTSGGSKVFSAGTGETSVTFVGGNQVQAVAEWHTATSDSTLYLIPLDSGGSEDFSLLSGTDTNGYHFQGTGTVDVQVWYEDFETYNSA